MTDTELATYLPIHGNRLRLRQLLKSEHGGKKKKLLQILQEKLDKAKSKSKREILEEEEMRRQYGNKNAYKDSRYIELGWIHKTHLRAKQVRSRTGGGTRKVCVKKDSTKQDILQEAIKLFFPNGESPKGKVNDFDIDLWDFSERIVENSVTLQQMYENTKMPMLRFYLSSKAKNNNDHVTSDTENDIVAKAMILSEVIEDDDLPEINIIREDQATVSNAKEDNYHNSVENQKNQMDENSETATVSSYPKRNNETIMNDDAFNTYPFLDLGEIPDLLNTGTIPVTVKEFKFKVHRGQVLKDLIDAFTGLDITNAIISFEMVMPNGNVEIAEDNGGVTRDTLSEFWNTFYDQCTLGTMAKVPCLRHDFGEKEWNAVGKILLFGWQTQKYFPVRFAQPFIEQCLYGRIHSSLQEHFLLHVSESEAATLKSALQDFDETDFEELLDVMVLHDSRKLPTKNTLPQVIEEMAHKELIQAPMFVCDCLQPVLKNMMEVPDLNKVYKKLVPSGKNIMKILSFPEALNVEEINTSNHLKRYVKELSSEKLGRFLRFCTGSDLLVSEKITVSFVNVTGLAKRPVAHTCSSLLELPKVYDSFPQFRSEFNAVLESNYWEMDFI